MSDSTTRAMPPRSVPRAAMSLVVVEGVDAGRSHRVEGLVRVGTSEHADLVLSDGAVSRRHLSVRPSQVGVHLRDEGSRNGTWIGATRVVEVELAPGDEVRVGMSVLRAEETMIASDAEPEPQSHVESFGRFSGRAEILQPLYRVLARAAASDITVLLEGESGSGKELLAEAIHERSPRAHAPLVVVDCGSLPENLIEAELLGHTRGAFTGADRARDGAFVRAEGGTVFLDEIGELPLPMQTRLLRVLDRKQVQPVGSSEVLQVDVRVVAATNRNLEREVEDGAFRLDLFHRLAVALLRVPPLRERGDDVVLLARQFVDRFGGDPAVLDEANLARIRRHRWPGNARELRNHVERLVLLGEADVPTALRAGEPGGGTLDALAQSGLDYRQARARVLDEFGRLYTDDMLERHGGNVSRAAEAAGVARRHFQRLKS